MYLTPASSGLRLSLAEFRAADHQEGYRYELIKGRVRCFPFPELPHAEVSDWVADWLRSYGRERGDVLNRVFAPSCVVGVNEATVLRPDVAAYAGFPRGSLSGLDWPDVSPLLVVEVADEFTAANDLGRKRAQYIRVASIIEYWIIDIRESADRPTLLVLRRRGSRWGTTITVGPGEAYTTRLLPGFRLVVDPHQEA